MLGLIGLSYYVDCLSCVSHSCIGQISQTANNWIIGQTIRGVWGRDIEQDNLTAAMGLSSLFSHAN